MTYKYSQYKKYFYIAIGWICVFSLLRYKEIGQLIGGANNYVVFLISFQLIVMPGVFVLIGYYARDISIDTNEKSIIYRSWLKKIELRWKDIKTVQRVGWWVEVKSNENSFKFSPLISSSKLTEISSKENIYRRCELLKEINARADNADIKGFPEGTFNESY